MATSPTNSAIGALGDLGRPSAAKPSAKSSDNAEKSSFSDVFHDARGSKPESHQRPAAEKRTTPKAATDNKTAVTPRSREVVFSGNKSAATAAKATPTGNDLPPAGESLPVTLDQLLANLTGDSGIDSSTDGKAKVSDDDSTDTDAASTATVDPLMTGPVVAAVMPENVVTAAASALAARSGQTTVADDGQPNATTAITDAKTAQKREIPTAAQTLNTAASLSGETVPTEISTDATASPAMPTVKTTEAAVRDKTAAAPDDPAAAVILPAVAATSTQTTTEPSDVQTATTDIAGVVLSPEKVLPEKMQTGKMAAGKSSGDIVANDKNSAALNAADSSLTDIPLADRIGGLSEQSSDKDSASFRDTLKQIDATLAPPAAKSNDTGAVTSTRDSGLRQYLDSSGTVAKVDVPVGKQGWSDAVAGKVMWMSSQNLSSAEIQMNPPDLGPLSVRVSSHQDQTSIYFTSPHASVREALDQSMPRLREMMGSQGIQLSDVGVGGQGSMREQRAFSDSGNGGGSRSGRSRETETDAEIGSVSRTVTTISRPGMLDAYA